MQQEETKMKDLLYYLNSKVMTTPYKGVPVTFYNFCSIKTAQIISLGVCVYNEEMEKITGQKYFQDITNALEYYDILWDVKQDQIKRILVHYENIRDEYYKLLRDGVNEKVASDFLIEEYNQVLEEKRLA
jgi:hypothetical protein